jgi:hypothetical protein
MEKQTKKEESWIMDCQARKAFEICSNIMDVIDDLLRIYADDCQEELKQSYNRIETLKNSIKQKCYAPLETRNEIRIIGKYILRMAMVIDYNYSEN